MSEERLHACEIRLLAIETRLNELNEALLFVMNAATIQMTIATGVVDQNGIPTGKMIRGSLMTFFQVAKSRGKTDLAQLTPEDFAQPIAEASKLVTA